TTVHPTLSLHDALPICGRSHDHAGGAVGALECALVEKGLLYGRELVIVLQAFDGRNLCSANFGELCLAGLHRFAVEQDGAGATQIGKHTSELQSPYDLV